MTSLLYETYSTPGASSSATKLHDLTSAVHSVDSPPNSSPVFSSDDELPQAVDPTRWLPPKDYKYMRRPTKHDRSRSETARPPNAFMLFRARMVVTELVEESQQEISRVAGDVWKHLPTFVREAWHDVARRIRREQELKGSPVLKEVRARTHSPSKKDRRKVDKTKGFATAPPSPEKHRSRRLSLPPPSRPRSPPSSPLRRPLPPQSPPPPTFALDLDHTANTFESADTWFEQFMALPPVNVTRSPSPSSSFLDVPPPVPPALSSSVGSSVPTPPMTPSMELKALLELASQYLHKLVSASRIPSLPSATPSHHEAAVTLLDVLAAFERIIKTPGCGDLHEFANSLMHLYIEKLLPLTVI